MKPARLLLAAGLLLAGTIVPAHPARAGAAPADSSARPIRLADAVALASRNGLAIIQARGQQRVSAASVRSTWASFLPTINLSAGATRQYISGSRTRVENGQIVTLPDEPWSYNAGIGASVQLFDGGQRLLELKTARANSEAEGANVTAQHFNVVLNAKEQFFNVLAARESEVAARTQLDQAEQQRRTAIARVRARAATRSDSLRSEIQVRNARLALLDARNARELADASLTRAVGVPYTVTASPADSLESTMLSVGDEAVIGLAETGPMVRQARAELDAARASRLSSWTGYLPTVTASYSRSANSTSRSFGLGGDDPTYSGSLRLSLSLPIWNQFQREEEVVRADVAEENARAALRDARLAAHESATRLLGTFHAAAERVAAQTASVEAAVEDLRVQQERYAAGNSTLLDVLTSQTQLDQARQSLIQARFDQRVAKAELEALVGREL
ncbi:MAG TPA: TolC family protein [Candidatus Eisenbacteria bacterium]